MTCIVGYLDKKTNKVTIGADSAAVTHLNVIVRKDPKLFTVKTEHEKSSFVIGCTSSFRMIQLLRFSFKPPEIKDKDIYEYMCTDFINAVRECFKNGGFMQKYNDGDEKGGRFLIGYKNRLFSIDDDFQVGEPLNGMDSVGCGSEYALGSLYTTSHNAYTELSATEKVLRALGSAEFFSGGVRAPFLIEETTI